MGNVISKLCEDESSSKINISKTQTSAQFPLKYLELTLVNLLLITQDETK